MSAPFDFGTPFICYSINCPLVRYPPPGSIPPPNAFPLPGPIPSPNAFVVMASNGILRYPTQFPSGIPSPPRFPGISPHLGYPQFSHAIPFDLDSGQEESPSPTVVFPESTKSDIESESLATADPETDPKFMFAKKTTALPTPTDIPVNFSTCTARFNGIGDVRPFINAVIDFKNWVDMTDETALRSFPLLLMDLAAIWWQANKDTVTTWSDAIDLLHTTYRARLQPYKVYRYLFSTHQQDEPTAVFVKKARAILNQLPPHTLTEVTQVDLVYGLLNQRITEKVNRNDCTGFSELIRLAQEVENSVDDNSSTEMIEVLSSSVTPSTPIKPVPEHEQSFVPAPLPEAETNASSNVENNVSSPCQHCKTFGHLLIGMCQKLHKKNIEEIMIKRLAELGEVHREIMEKVVNPPPKIYCFRCGSLDIVRFKCQDCVAVAIGSGIPIKPTGRPYISANICDMNFDFVIDTGARYCIATNSLTAHLVANNQEFTYDHLELPLGDGIIRQILRVATVDVWVAGVAVPTSFIDVPQATTNVLGMDFILDAGLVLDFRGKGTWFLRDMPEKNALMFESPTKY